MPDDVKNVNLYEQDFFAWGLAQAGFCDPPGTRSNTRNYGTLSCSVPFRRWIGTIWPRRSKGWLAGIGVNWQAKS